MSDLLALPNKRSNALLKDLFMWLYDDERRTYLVEFKNPRIVLWRPDRNILFFDRQKNNNYFQHISYDHWRFNSNNLLCNIKVAAREVKGIIITLVKQQRENNDRKTVSKGKAKQEKICILQHLVSLIQQNAKLT